MKQAGAACLMGMALVTAADVVGRMFNRPVFGSEEIVTILATLVIGFSLPYAHLKNSHIGVEILIRAFSPKNQTRIKLGTDIAALALFALVTWRMGVYAETIRKSGEVSMNLELPEYLVIYALTACFLIFTLFILQDVLSFFRKADPDQ
ncbi:MAG: TRAP transporter small permease [Thermodesulfobacteriota bacterium]|nr:TRAP transporter small permease [Thermodesulfobacteriota bacterium]